MNPSPRSHNGATNHHPADQNGRAPLRLGVFSRLVDQVEPAEIYARGLSLFQTAEELGFDVGWVAQHHAHKEGGLPSPLVFLSAAAARTSRLRLATGIITLPLEHPLRLAEDAAVLDVLAGGDSSSASGPVATPSYSASSNASSTSARSITSARSPSFAMPWRVNHCRPTDRPCSRLPSA